MGSGRTEVPGMYKEKDGVILNRDPTALQSYKLRKEKERKINTLQEDIDSLKGDIQEIKALLKGLSR